MPEFYTLYSVVKVRILYKSSTFIADVFTTPYTHITSGFQTVSPRGFWRCADFCGIDRYRVKYQIKCHKERNRSDPFLFFHTYLLITAIFLYHCTSLYTYVAAEGNMVSPYLPEKIYFLSGFSGIAKGRCISSALLPIS